MVVKRPLDALALKRTRRLTLHLDDDYLTNPSEDEAAIQTTKLAPPPLPFQFNPVPVPAPVVPSAPS
jgi:hypothetical protein